MKNIKKYLSLSCLMVIIFNGHAQSIGTDSGCVTNPPDFSKMSYKEAEETIHRECNVIESGVKKVCPEYVVNLVSQLKSGRLSNDNKVLAIDLLGTLCPNNPDAIEFLIQNIDFERTRFDPPDRISIQLKYPCEGALMIIGKPAVNPIMNHLIDETNVLRRHLMCEVLKKIENKVMAQNQIKQKMADELDSRRQANLGLALQELEK